MKRSCEVCGKSTSNKRFCSTKCSQPVLAKEQGARKHAAYVEARTHPCANPKCNKLTVNKKFCDRSCAAQVTNAVPRKRGPQRVSNSCTSCNKRTVGYLDQTSLCKSCYISLWIEEWKQGSRSASTKSGETASWVRPTLKSMHGDCCHECGFAGLHPILGVVPLQLEHKDGDSSNNFISNLTLLCGTCHTMTPYWGALNTKHGREKWGLPDRPEKAGRYKRQLKRLQDKEAAKST